MRAILIMGPGRCGSSAVAGLLHAAGIPTDAGQPIGPHPQWNPRGHFEDRRTHRLNRLVAHNLADHPDIQRETTGIYPDLEMLPDDELERLAGRYIAHLKLLAQPPIYAMKCVMLGTIWPFVKYLFPTNRRVIVVHRNWEPMIRSRMAHSNLSRAEAEQLTRHLQQDIYESTESEHVLHVSYDQLVAEPEHVAGCIIEFAAGGMDMWLDLGAAINSIDRSLDHASRDSFNV